MKCVSCDMEINPKWKHSIDNNICPFCGLSVVEENLKNLLSDLSEIMIGMLDYPDQLNDWMLSNHNFIKTDSPDLVKYISPELLKEFKKTESEKDFQERKERKIIKVKTDGVEQDVLVEKTQSDEKTNEFFARAEVVKPRIDGFTSTANKTEKLKALKQKIESEGKDSKNAHNFLVSESSNAEDFDVSELEGLVDESSIINSAIVSNDGFDDEIPGESVINAMSRMKNNSNNNHADILKARQQHQKLADSKKNFHSGGGSFSR